MDSLLNIYQYLAATRPKTFGLLSLIGVLVVLSKFYRVLKQIYKNFLRPSRNLSKRYGAKSWVLVTGSSDGIGRQFALSLAKRGFNVILTARTQSKLQLVQQQIKEMYPNCQTLVIPTDFKHAANPGFIDQYMKLLENLNISVLVNNVGMEVIEPYHQMSQETITNMITVNCTLSSLLTREFLPRFLQRKQKSAIINVSSDVVATIMSSFHLYASTKAFDDYFSRALSYEYPQLDIISLKPNQVSTSMVCNKPPDLMTITPEQCVQGLLGDLGYERESNGHIRHKLFNWAIRLLPESIFSPLFKRVIFPGFVEERKRLTETASKRS